MQPLMRLEMAGLYVHHEIALDGNYNGTRVTVNVNANMPVIYPYYSASSFDYDLYMSKYKCR